MATDFKLGLLGAEYDLPTCVSEELPVDADDIFNEAEMEDGSYDYCAKSKTRETHTLEFVELTLAECGILAAIAAIKKTLNYINGYAGITGQSVVVANYSKPTLIVNTSGLTTPRYRATMILKTVD